jgi:FKBP-type peptidyl-prolyl cis-trans isomerase
MKNCFLLLFALTVFFSSVAQKTPVKTTAPAVPVLKNANDSVSYVLGEVAAYQLIQQGFGDVKINNTVFLRAVNDILGKKTPLMDDAAANACLNSYMEKATAAKIQPQIDADAKFLAQNAQRPGVKTTASGLQYEVITEGTGIKPARLDTFVAHYRGTLVNGTEFDASYNRGQPLTYGVSQVIPGWTEGLQLMSVGSKYKFWIPYNLGYGTRGNGQIPGGAALIFELELLEVKKKE